MKNLSTIMMQLILAAGLAGSAFAGMEYSMDGVNYTSANRVGGSGGDHDANSTCPAHTVAVGLQIADDGQYVTGLALICASVDRVGFWTTTQTADFVGQSSAHRTNRLCSSGRVLSGFAGRQGWYVDAITVTCSVTVPNFTNNTVGRTSAATTGSPVGGAGGTAENVGCSAASAFIWYIDIRWGWYVDSVTGTCRVLKITDVIPNRASIQFALRTTGQESVLPVNGSDGFSVDVFNFGFDTAPAGTVSVTLQTTPGVAKIDVSSASVACTVNQQETLAVCHIPNSITTDHSRTITGLVCRRIGNSVDDPTALVIVKTQMVNEPVGTILQDTAAFPVFN